MFHASVPRVFSLLIPATAKLFLFKLFPLKSLCFYANISVSFVASSRISSACDLSSPRIAPTLCNPYHRVEYCGVNPFAASSFHKVINIHVQNFIAQK